MDNQYKDKAQTEGQCRYEAKDPPNLFCTVAHGSAFDVYNALDGPEAMLLFPRPVTMQGPLIQASKLDVKISKLLEGAYEPAPFPSHVLAAIATNISNIAWLKSGSVKAVDKYNAPGRVICRESHVQVGHIDESRKNDHLHFEEGKNK
ncbi:hypothetical protein F0562_016252 [Nyssa sinensis]|uniref:Uncharacterized protein n=1 Tax=Nyssa sinensis TaxID=561372 RepID=A0A5J4ZMF5_9ASTE|nr:hypothetical protein F0562_016252 [Nyssa sinensis]